MDGCEAIRDELCELLDGELTAERRAGVELHLRGCAPCRAEWESLRAASDAVRCLPRRRAPASILAAVHAELQAGRVGVAVGSRTIQAGDEFEARKSRSWRAGLLSAAALVAVGVLVFVAAGPHFQTPEATVVPKSSGTHSAESVAANRRLVQAESPQVAAESERANALLESAQQGAADENARKFGRPADALANASPNPQGLAQGGQEPPRSGPNPEAKKGSFREAESLRKGVPAPAEKVAEAPKPESPPVKSAAVAAQAAKPARPQEPMAPPLAPAAPPAASAPPPAAEGRDLARNEERTRRSIGGGDGDFGEGLGGEKPGLADAEHRQSKAEPSGSAGRSAPAKGGPGEPPKPSPDPSKSSTASTKNKADSAEKASQDIDKTEDLAKDGKRAENLEGEKKKSRPSGGQGQAKAKEESKSMAAQPAAGPVPLATAAPAPAAPAARIRTADLDSTLKNLQNIVQAQGGRVEGAGVRHNLKSADLNAKEAAPEEQKEQLEYREAPAADDRMAADSAKHLQDAKAGMAQRGASATTRRIVIQVPVARKAEILKALARLSGAADKYAGKAPGTGAGGGMQEQELTKKQAEGAAMAEPKPLSTEEAPKNRTEQMREKMEKAESGEGTALGMETVVIEIEIIAP